MIDFVDPVTGEKRQIPVMLPKVGNIHTFYLFTKRLLQDESQIPPRADWYCRVCKFWVRDRQTVFFNFPFPFSHTFKHNSTLFAAVTTARDATI